MPDKIYPLKMLPGIEKDGTRFSSRSYIDGKWCRFYRGLPRKMGGYVQITDIIESIPRGMFVVPSFPNFLVYFGDSNHIQYIRVSQNGSSISTISGIIDRTPRFFKSDANNVWSFDIMYSTTDNGGLIIAHAAPNLRSIDSNSETTVWWGELSLYSEVPPIGLSLSDTGFKTSGGIVVLHPYLFIFGNDGSVIWTEANNPRTELGSARVTGSKIVAGLPTRGGNSSPAGLLWSLDSVIRVTQVGTNSVEFSFDTVSSESSILSSRSVIEYDGLYYWAAVDRFLVYNGAVQELPNDMCLDYFFSNIDMDRRQKVWVTKITKWGEIWWHFVSKNSPNGECDNAICYNVREKRWYTTEIDRGSGYFDQVFSYPVWSANKPNSNTFPVYWSNISDWWVNLTYFYWLIWPRSNSSYSLWAHENGLDKKVGNLLTAIESYFETGSISWVASDPNSQSQEIDRWVDLYRIEPDFIQSGPITCIVNGKEYARSAIQSSSKKWTFFTAYSWQNANELEEVENWKTWGDYVFDENTEKIDMREQRREMTLKFVSNSVGGYYEMGQTLFVAKIGDARQ